MLLDVHTLSELEKQLKDQGYDSYIKSCVTTAEIGQCRMLTVEVYLDYCKSEPEVNDWEQDGRNT